MNTTSPTTHEWRFATDETPSLHLRSHRGTCGASEAFFIGGRLLTPFIDGVPDR